MQDLQQRTPAWFAARRGKLTCSNLGAMLGQVSYVSRPEAYRRAMGTAEFKGNLATDWGTNNEENAIAAYSAKTGNLVTATGLYPHPKLPWLAGSPDGLVATDGMIEVKCPYYKKRDGSSRVHKSVPGHYWMQINALLECTGRQWCDYVCWAPEGMAVYRVQRDAETFDWLSQFYTQVYAAISALSPQPPPLSRAQIDIIGARIEAAMERGVSLSHWAAQIDSAPPCNDSDVEMDEDAAQGKRERVPDDWDREGALRQRCEAVHG